MKKLFTLILIVTSISVNAQVLVENMSYTTATPLVGSGNWAITGTSVVNPLTIVTPGLTYAGYAGSNIGNAVAMANTGQDANTPFAGAASISTGKVYCSFMLNISAAQTGDYFFHLANPAGTTTNFYSRVYAKAGTTGFNIGLSKASGTADYGTVEYSFNTTYLVVVKYAFNTGSFVDDSSSVFVFSSGVPATEPTTPAVGPVGSATAASDATAISSIALRQGTAASAPTLTIDGFRVSDSWNTSPLPITLKSFSASMLNDKGKLNWRTANEMNAHGFGVEKSSNGISYTEIGFVAATNNATNQYSFTDAVLAKGANYYRLKMLDKDAKFSYSNIATINTKSVVGAISIYPNPTVNILGVTHEKATSNTVAKITSLDGKTIASYPLQIGATTSSIDVSKLIKGNYIISIENGYERQAAKFVKQ